MPITSDHELIRNTIAGVAIALDTKSFSKLKTFFSENCEVEYASSLGVLRGPDEVISKLEHAIGKIETFHALSTQVITLTGEGKAEAVTYVAAAHYRDGREFHVKGKYEDDLQSISTDGSTQWVITKRRALEICKFEGDISIFELE